jgi:hypothetical protein
MDDPDELRIKSSIEITNQTIIATFTDPEAWKHYVDIRYHNLSTRVKQIYRNVDKRKSYLVIYVVTTAEADRTKIGIKFYMDKRTEDNMFHELPYDVLSSPDVPKILKKLL